MGDVDTRVQRLPGPSNPGQTQTDPNGKGDPGKTQTDPKKPKAVEWGMRADCAIDYGGDKIGRLVDEPMNCSEGDGEPRKVRLFVDMKEKASPDDGLDDDDDSSSNHPRLPKKLEKHPIHGWVRVPKPTSPSNDHHDYSYHGPPPNKESKSSGSGSSGSGSNVPTGGATIPGTTGSDPNGSTRGGSNGSGGMVTPGGSDDTGSGSTGGGSDGSTQTHTDGNGQKWTRPITPGGLPAGPWVPEDAAPSAPSTSQADQGHIQAQSPEFCQRTNCHKYDAERDIVGVFNERKPKGYTTLKITVDYKTSAELSDGQWIVLDVVVSNRDSQGLPPKNFYGCAIGIGNDVVNRALFWQQSTWTFRGFPTQQQFLEVYIVRRAYTLGGDFGAVVPATQHLYVCQMTCTYDDQSNAAASSLGGYGFAYGEEYGEGL